VIPVFAARSVRIPQSDVFYRTLWKSARPEPSKVDERSYDERMEDRERQEIRDEIAALRARSERLLAQSEVLREKSEAMGAKLAEAEAVRRRQRAEKA